MFFPGPRPQALIKSNDIPADVQLVMVRNSGFIDEQSFVDIQAVKQKPGLVRDFGAVREACLQMLDCFTSLGFVMIGGGGNFQAKEKKQRLDKVFYDELVEAGIAQPLPKAKRLIVSSGKKRG
jgi:hypothetical protein